MIKCSRLYLFWEFDCKIEHIFAWFQNVLIRADLKCVQDLLVVLVKNSIFSFIIEKDVGLQVDEIKLCFKLPQLLLNLYFDWAIYSLSFIVFLLVNLYQKLWLYSELWYLSSHWYLLLERLFLLLALSSVHLIQCPIFISLHLKFYI